MSSIVDPNVKTAYASTDWDHYMGARPAYPPSLTDIVNNYRRTHHAGSERLVDIGSGVGVASINFAPDFRVVHLSDPSPSNIEAARIFLPGWLREHDYLTKIEFSQSKGEEAYQHVGERCADLVISATAAHWTDPDQLIESVAKILRPGGILAVYGYFLPIFPDQSQHFNDVFIGAAGKTMRSSFDPGDEMVKKVLQRAAANSTCGGGGMDFLPLKDEYFTDPMRVRINTDKREMRYNDQLLTQFPWQVGEIPTRVAAAEKVIDYRSGTDPEAEGWSFTRDKAWIYGFMTTLRGSKGPILDEEQKTEYAEWEDIFANDCPSGTVRIAWPVHIALATRR